ncbi:MAG TPA: NUDIX hydrolase [Pseudonocardiaceae bacterium]
MNRGRSDKPAINRAAELIVGEPIAPPRPQRHGAPAPGVRAAVSYTADMVALAEHDGAWHVLLIQRGKPPYRGLWALPGGHVDPGETAEEAARRELAEETGVTAGRRLDLIGVYDTPGRDPRGRYVSAAYLAVLHDLPPATAGDDAARARWVPLTDLPGLGIAFDHAQILGTALSMAGLTPGGGSSLPDGGAR